jgi:hypothetical protein
MSASTKAMAAPGAYVTISSGTNTCEFRRRALIAQSTAIIAAPFHVNPANHESHQPETRLAHARLSFIATAPAGSTGSRSAD